MKSMTGFGQGTVNLDQGVLTLQIHSVNRKNLEIAVSLPDDWDSLEQVIIERVRGIAVRGTIKAKVTIADLKKNAVLSAVDDGAVMATLDQIEVLAKKRGIPFQPTADLIWQIASAQRTSPGFPTVEDVREAVLHILDLAIKDFVQMRSVEGLALQTDLLGRIAAIKTAVAVVAEGAPRVPVAHRDALLKRLRDARLDLSVDDERVLKEIALFADRCDVTEELTRLKSHLDQFTTMLHSEGEVGRKAEFIVQEIGRELNTIGSKANDLTISRSVIDAKNELERIREQLANVE